MSANRCFGVVAEFNPFHNGHAELCRQAREQGASHLLAAMSGNFVQRGSFAVTDKWVRADAALHGGIDMVIELPLPYALSSARQFARGAVSLLKSTGCVDGLCFGSESGEVGLLREAAQAVDDPRVIALTRDLQSAGITYAKARQAAVEEVCGEETARCLATPNDILAVEYIRQCRLLSWNVEWIPIKRKGVAHDSISTGDRFASASYLREHHMDEWRDYVPASAFAIYREASRNGRLPAAPQQMETAILSHLRRLPMEALEQLPDISEGLERRLYKAIRCSGSLAELELQVKSKRYTLARVRRLILCAFLGVRREHVEAAPPYIRIIGCNRKGTELLSEMKGAAIPVHTSLRQLSRQSAICAALADLEAMSGDQYALSQPDVSRCGSEFSRSAIFDKEV
ncbi:nucleotidyltransferase family protein [Ruminococcaceae bacterium OttesenSCG-928-L11]|nr:nucleotidyltransferase family protein [Ruminococcaceae bacterium OttesenSCG-928-L11]